ncbi:MAG: response regulator [Clostridium sp.]|nr:response regulator [Clostridium sp.]
MINNYIVDRVFDGDDGLDYMLTDIYDLVILDIMLPKRDGLSILKEARGQYMQKVKMVLLSL